MWHVLKNENSLVSGTFISLGLSEFVESFDSWRKAEVQIDMAFSNGKDQIKGVNVSWQP